jgi:hypothetical protein
MLALVPSQKPQRHVLALWAHRTTLNDLMQNGQSLWDAHFRLSIGLLPACSVSSGSRSAPLCRGSPGARPHYLAHEDRRSSTKLKPAGWSLLTSTSLSDRSRE